MVACLKKKKRTISLFYLSLTVLLGLVGLPGTFITLHLTDHFISLTIIFLISKNTETNTKLGKMGVAFKRELTILYHFYEAV